MIISLIPGTFNPFHNGHKAIGDYCAKRGEKVCYCVSAYPFDKTDIPSVAIRYKQMSDTLMVMTFESRSLAGLLLEAIGNFYLWGYSLDDGFRINIGIDTLTRVNDMKYYPDKEYFETFLEDMYQTNTKIRAFPRNGVKYLDLHPKLESYVEFAVDFEEVNISSTELRNKNEV